MKKRYNIALVAHDHCKADLADWVAFNRDRLKKHHLICTGTTGRIIEQELNKDLEENDRDYHRVLRLKSGPLGGDQQLGALIAEGKIDMMFFFWDPMSQQPHDVDVKALLRIGVLYNIPTACCRSTADFIIASSLFEDDSYQPQKADFNNYITRTIE
ncbi:MAG: methylglyoxal synthase [Bacteroidales bacterium]|nr:methylglyoxal synthase [Bacteroidales bacterium]